MKILIPLLLALLVLPLAFAGTQNSIYYNSTLVYHADTSIAVDNSTDLLSGAAAGSPQLSTTNKKLGEGSLYVNGDDANDDYIRFTSQDSSNTMLNVTAYGWGNWSSSSISTLFSRGPSVGTGGIDMHIRTTNRLQCILYTDDVGGNVQAVYDNADVVGGSHFNLFGCMINITGSTAYVYALFNGTTKAEGSGAYAGGSATGDLFIGGRSDLNTCCFGEAGTDEITVLNRTLREDEWNFIYNSGQGYINEPEPALPDITFPEMRLINLSSNGGEGNIIFEDGVTDRRQGNPVQTNDSTPTIRTTTNEDAFVAGGDFGFDLNFTDWNAYSGKANASTHGGTNQIWTLHPDNESAIGVHNFSFGCRDAAGNENLSSCSGLFEINITDGENPLVQWNESVNHVQVGINNTGELYLNATDNHAVGSLEVRRNGTLVYSNTTYFNGSRVAIGFPLGGGVYNFSALATDNFSNTNQTDFLFTVLPEILVPNVTLSLNGQQRDREYEYPYIYTNISNGQDYTVPRTVIVNVTSNLSVESCIYIDKELTGCGMQNWTYFLNVTGVSVSTLNGSEFTNLSSPGIHNVTMTMDNQTDLNFVIMNLSGIEEDGEYPTDVHVNLQRDGTRDVFLAGVLRGNVLTQTNFSIGGSYGGQGEVLITGGTSVSLNINASNAAEPLNLTFLVSGKDLDLENEFDYTEHFNASDAPTKNITLSINVDEPLGVFDTFTHNITDRWSTTNCDSGETFRYNSDSGEDYLQLGMTGSTVDQKACTRTYTGPEADLRNTSIMQFDLNLILSASRSQNADCSASAGWTLYATDGTNLVVLDTESISKVGNPEGTSSSNQAWNYTLEKVSADYTTWKVLQNGSDLGNKNLGSLDFEQQIKVIDKVSVSNGPAGGTCSSSSQARANTYSWGGVWLEMNKTNGTYHREGNYTSTVINVTKTNVSTITLYPASYEPAGTNIDYYVSNTCNATAPTFESVFPEVTHTFTTTGNSVCWRCALSSTINTTSPICKKATLEVEASAIENVTVFFGESTDSVWNYGGKLNSSTSPKRVNGSIEDLEEYRSANCGNSTLCQIPVTISLGSGGLLNVSSMNYSGTVSDIRLNKTKLEGESPFNFSFFVEKGILQVGRIISDFKGSRNYTIEARTSTTNASFDQSFNDSHLAMFKYSKFTCGYTQGISSLQLQPRRFNETNITVFGQEFRICSSSSDDYCIHTSKPVYNCTSQAYDDGINITAYSNASIPPQINFTMDLGVNRTTAVKINDTNGSQIMALDQNNWSGIFIFVDFINMTREIFNSMDTSWDIQFKAKCDGCVT